jgi:hypothetical protein
MHVVEKDCRKAILVPRLFRFEAAEWGNENFETKLKVSNYPSSQSIIFRKLPELQTWTL